MAQRTYEIGRGHQYSRDGVHVICKGAGLFAAVDPAPEGKGHLGLYWTGGIPRAADGAEVAAAAHRVLVSGVSETIVLGEPTVRAPIPEGDDWLTREMDRADSDY